ncbi:hypothetical protein JYT86_00560 [bacterium AH-315-N03]|nr:hypothetical protein [bacterium AH-315-N03]
MMRRTLMSLVCGLALVGCTSGEGTEVGDCTDRADNDGDGLFDCADPGCAGSPDCLGFDAGLDGGGDAGPPALFADIQYGIECDATGGCEPAPNRDICGIDQNDPCPEVGGMATLSCTVAEAGASRTVTFSASQNMGFSISVTEMIVPIAGGSAGGGSCSVRVVDGANTYVGVCGSGTPTSAQPCQITGVRFYDDVGNPTVEGDIFCLMLENSSNPLLEIELHAKGSDAMAVVSPGTFRIANCDGLVL